VKEMNNWYNGNIFSMLIGNRVTNQEKIRRVEPVERKLREFIYTSGITVNEFISIFINQVMSLIGLCKTESDRELVSIILPKYKSEAILSKEL
jgi:hypothetical protein